MRCDRSCRADDEAGAARRDRDDPLMGQKVGFVGLGRAGWNMAENLLRGGYELAVIDADAGREHEFAASHPGVRVGLECFHDAEVSVTMLPNGHVVRRVLLEDEGGLAQRLTAGAIVIDASSSDPAGTRRLGAELANRGVTLVDAPVTRPVHDHINTRRIVFMVGGPDDAVDRVLPLLEAMGERVFRVGELGNGHTVRCGRPNRPGREGTRRSGAARSSRHSSEAAAAASASSPAVG
jgi:3-hydroxyisobutyrate dehydrogenase